MDKVIKIDKASLNLKIEELDRIRTGLYQLNNTNCMSALPFAPYNAKSNGPHADKMKKFHYQLYSIMFAQAGIISATIKYLQGCSEAYTKIDEEYAEITKNNKLPAPKKMQR